MNGLRALQRYVRVPVQGHRAEESCELCRSPVEPEHRHLVDLEQRSFACACRACALLFMQPGAARGRYRTVPERVVVDPASPLTEEDWAALEMPVRLAFFFRNSRASKWIAFYPGPVGATECDLPLDAWQRWAEQSALAATVEPDVEALLAWREELFLVPIVTPYELVGRVRRTWRGFDGGDETRTEIATFFGDLRARAQTLRTGVGGAR